MEYRQEIKIAEGFFLSSLLKNQNKNKKHMSDHILVIYSFILKLFMKVAANFYCISFFFLSCLWCILDSRQAVGKINFFLYMYLLEIARWKKKKKSSEFFF